MEGASFKAHFRLPWENRRPDQSRKEAARESLHYQHIRLLKMLPLRVKNRCVRC